MNWILLFFKKIFNMKLKKTKNIFQNRFCQKSKDQNDLESSNDVNNNVSEILSPIPLNGVYECNLNIFWHWTWFKTLKKKKNWKKKDGSIASMEDALSVPGTSVSDTYVSLPDAALSEGPTCIFDFYFFYFC